MGDVDNASIAEIFEAVAELLEAQHANVFKIRAWRDGARQLRELDEPVAQILGACGETDAPAAGSSQSDPAHVRQRRASGVSSELASGSGSSSAGKLERQRPSPRSLLDVGGRDALCAIPHIGRGLAAAIDEIVHTGRLSLLSRLQGEVSPEALFETIPGIGPELAELIHRELDIETLEGLELAAHDGRLEAIDGIGPRRAEAIRDILAARLSRSVRRRARHLDGLEHEDGDAPRVDVGTLIEADAEYRREASLGNLRTIAPRRFNASGEAWLPVMHRDAQGWELTVLFSNTARAHDLGKTRDWVVVIAYHGGHEEQWTVVTETRGPLAGLRVVRGRERECERWYAQLKARGRPGRTDHGT